MGFPLLATKVYIPPARPNAVSRPRLIETLVNGLDQPGRFALLSAPAGFGKTTLLSELAAHSHQPLAWLSLDAGDNDPNRFWSYVIAACRSAQKDEAKAAGLGASVLELLRAPQSLPVEMVPTLLINDLANQPGDLILVLDDYHAIQNESIHAAVLYLLEHLPANLHPVIATRMDPPWPLARFRARNLLIEVRTDAMRFTTAEAADFLNRVTGLDLTGPDVLALEARTEGWIAGLQLAALSVKGHSDRSAYIQSFTGSHVYIVEYLVEEVLRQQAEDVQRFLLQTAILNRLTAGLCEAVTGCADGGAILDSLYHANLFINPQDDEGRWFRYHNLFGDLLRARLQRSLPKAETAALHRRAAAWYEAAGMTQEAVAHALAAEDYSYAVRLVGAVALPMIMQAYFQTVEDWVRAVPAEHLSTNPQINIALAWMHLMRRNSVEALPYLNRLRSIFSAVGSEAVEPALQGEWLALQAMLLNTEGKTLESLTMAEQALALLPEQATRVRSMIYMGLANAYLQTFQFERAEAACREIIEQSRRGGDLASELFGISYLALLMIQQGKLRAAYELASGALEQVERAGSFSPFSATLYGEVAEISYEWGRYEPARAHYERSVSLSTLGGFSDAEIYYSVFLSRLHQMEGNLPAAEQEIHKALGRMQTAAPAFDREEVIAQQVRVCLALGQIAEAQAALKPFGFAFEGGLTTPPVAPDGSFPHTAGLLYVAALRILVSRFGGRNEPAALIDGLTLADRIIEASRRTRQLPILLKAHLLKSQMHALLADQRKSMAEAAAALELAEPQGFLSLFLEEGRPMACILVRLLEQGGPVGSQRTYIQKIMAAFSSLAGADNRPAAQLPADSLKPGNRSLEAAPLVEPLTQRELEVLRLIAAGASNRAIAEQLVITVSAVKKHTGNIYGKLNVSSRTQAVACARQLHLLPDGD